VLPAYARLADELLAQADGPIAAFVQMVGTAGSIRGIGTRLRERSPGTRIVAVEPAESPLLAGGRGGSHGIEGAGPGFVPPLWGGTPHDAIVGVSTDDAMAMARRLAREEGIFAGTSTGANVIAALAEAARLGPGDRVVTLAIDGGMKYLSTALYRTP
jgi:cysteine synthase A